MLILYFSATGNTRFVAEVFGRDMGAKCLSIEDEVDFAALIKSNEIVAFCFPIYGSRPPRNMREFVQSHGAYLAGKKVVILATQMMFSGDGARSLADSLPASVNVIYSQHFNMPNNICNTPMLRHASRRKIDRCKRKAEAKIVRICGDIRQGVVKKRGFSGFARMMGNMQGKTWLKMEGKARGAVKIHSDCAACGLCVEICPVGNLEMQGGGVGQLGDCVTCYRCVNKCPRRAITVLFHRVPRWQYKGL